MTSPVLRFGPTILSITALIVGTMLLAARTPAPAVTPDFAAIEEPELRKERFFEWLAPLIDQENARVRQVRRRLRRLEREALEGRNWSATDADFMAGLAEYYKVSEPVQGPGSGLEELLRRVDTVPSRLVLAQGAVESGWGTSRFARDANNYFGIWTWRHEGLIPDERPGGADHAVAVYEDAAESVRVYLYTLDVGAAYGELRRLRAEARDRGRIPQAEVLAAGLSGYSERGEAYVEEVRLVLRANAGLLDDVLEGTR